MEGRDKATVGDIGNDTSQLALLGKLGLAACMGRLVCHCKDLAVNCSAYQGDLLSGSCGAARKK